MDGGKRISGIGTLSEKTLHAVLKNYYEPFQDNHEIKIGGFIADAVGEYGILEIQTGNFKRMQKKLRAFLDVTDVTVVYPIVHDKYYVWVDTEKNEISKKRKSSVKFNIYNIFSEIYPLKDFVGDNNLKLRIAVIDMIYYYNANGRTKKDRRRNKCDKLIDRVPQALVDEIYLQCVDDYKQFIPQPLEDGFTQKEFASCAGINDSLAGYTLYFLRAIGLVERYDKRGNAFLYRRMY